MATVKVGEKEYPVRFDINVMADIQERYGEITRFAEQLSKLKELRWILYLIINEGISYDNIMNNHTNPSLTEQYVGMLLGLSDLQSNELTESIINAFNDCLGDEKKMTVAELTEMGLKMMEESQTQ